MGVFFFKQKTAYEMRISDWSSDVCSSDLHPLSEALANSDLIHDRAALETAIAKMAVAIRKDYSEQPPVFLTVMNGGMFFGALLALELESDIVFDYLHATRYRGQTDGGTLTWLRRPRIDLTGKRVLLVDDILDEGPPLDEVRRWCLDQGAAEVRVAVLTGTRHGRGLPSLEIARASGGGRGRQDV